MSTVTRPVPATRTRPAAAALASSLLTGLVAAFTGAGAAYFAGEGGYTVDGLTFLVAFESLSLLGLVSAVALARRSALGRAGVVAFGLWMSAFSAFKVGYVHETESLVFGVAALAALALALTSSVRAYVAR